MLRVNNSRYLNCWYKAVFLYCLKFCSGPSVQTLLKKWWLLRTVPLQLSFNITQLQQCIPLVLLSFRILAYHISRGPQKLKLNNNKKNKVMSLSDTPCHFSNPVFMSLCEIGCFSRTARAPSTVLLCYLYFYFNISMVFHLLQKDPSSAPGLSWTCLVSPQMTRWKLW